MGMGKTIETIALVLKSNEIREERKRLHEDVRQSQREQEHTLSHGLDDDDEVAPAPQKGKAGRGKSKAAVGVKGKKGEKEKNVAPPPLREVDSADDDADDEAEWGKTTLVVCPKSVLDQWNGELKYHSIFLLLMISSKFVSLGTE